MKLYVIYKYVGEERIPYFASADKESAIHELNLIAEALKSRILCKNENCVSAFNNQVMVFKLQENDDFGGKCNLI